MRQKTKVLMLVPLRSRFWRRMLGARGSKGSIAVEDGIGTSHGHRLASEDAFETIVRPSCSQ